MKIIKKASILALSVCAVVCLAGKASAWKTLPELKERIVQECKESNIPSVSKDSELYSNMRSKIVSCLTNELINEVFGGLEKFRKCSIQKYEYYYESIQKHFDEYLESLSN